MWLSAVEYASQHDRSVLRALRKCEKAPVAGMQWAQCRVEEQEMEAFVEDCFM